MQPITQTERDRKGRVTGGPIEPGRFRRQLIRFGTAAVVCVALGVGVGFAHPQSAGAVSHAALSQLADATTSTWNVTGGPGNG